MVGWKKALVVTALAMATVPALAADVYVKAGASGKGTSADKPVGYLWKAISKARRGDVVHVAQGVYNGKGGSGAFMITVPDLTLVGGYNDDFSARQPFENLTILERAADYKGDATGLGEGIVAGKEGTAHKGFILDGFWIDSFSRNDYKSNGDINPKLSWKGALVQVFDANFKMRNCVMMNPYGKGLYARWKGEDNEVSNCFFINCFYTAISTRAAQPESKINIAGNTVSFTWFQPGSGGGTAMFVGSQGATEIRNNVLMFSQDFSVNNGFGNEDTVLSGNIFYQCQNGYYKYHDDEGRNLLIWKAEELESLNEDAEDYMLMEAEDNSDTDPGCKPDKDYFEKFSNTVASEPGKLKMDEMNKWRQALGLPLQAAAGSARKNWGMRYPREGVAGLVCKLDGKGAQWSGPFAAYKSETGEAESYDYKETDFALFKKGSPSFKSFADTPVTFKGMIGAQDQSTYMLKGINKAEYDCYKVSAEKVDPDRTRDVVRAYFLKGSEAHADWLKYYNKRAKYNKKGGVVLKGRASYCGNDNYAVPVGLVVDEVSRK